MRNLEKRALQIMVAVGSLVPIVAGAAGVWLGPRLVDNHIEVSEGLESHFRYLSGLLLGIGLAYAASVPRIEKRERRFLLLTGIVVIGGLARLYSVVTYGPPTWSIAGALTMELLVTPGLWLWQRRIAKRA
jgi:hypothetical protein